ncbi:tetratricopeptide repeat-containing sensor histidine kinase [uncultured Tenacibaculum sp.]|uniref:ATP-binding protein n=1 Tax=uncultured Tenacibaculum sp. TaxID=174713 RepID=UPI002632A899|nr:tetratricopeptide repeat-containing sensor histidine kinase [uncultured Tenacibaculum sp.]
MKLKAESAHSAFGHYNIQQKDSIYQKKYEIAKILYEDDEYVKALRLLLPIADTEIKDTFLGIKINVLTGKVLNEFNDKREVFFDIDRIYDKSKKEKEESLNALKYLKKSFRDLKKIDLDKEQEVSIEVDRLLGENYLELSGYFLHARKKDSAKYYLNELFKIQSLDHEFLKSKAKGFTNLGRLYIFERDLKKAEESFINSIELNKIVKNNISIALAYNNLASVYGMKKDFEKAKELYKSGLDYLKEENSLKAVERKEMLLDNYAWALYNLKDYRAYEFVNESFGIRDSLKGEEYKMQLKKIKAKNDVDKVQQEADEQQSKQEQKTWIVGATGVLISILLLYLANLYKLRQRNLSLKLSQNELRQQRRLERLNSQAQVKILNATLDGKETERKQIAEILHDNVSALLSSANMHLEATQKQYGDNIPEELQKTQQIITEASEKIRDLSHNLVSSILLKFGLEYATKDAAKKYSNSEIKISTAILNVYRYSQDFEIKVFNIIQELINNILKHSKAKNAYIMLEEESEMINLIVKDDGVGFDDQSEEDAGIGLNQIKARINMMNGNFLIESSKGNGTKVIVSIPVIRDHKMALA